MPVLTTTRQTLDLSELSARVAAAARRYRGNPSPIIQVGELMIDLGDHCISRNGLPVELTAREWALFEGFIQRPGMLVIAIATGGSSIRFRGRNRK